MEKAMYNRVLLRYTIFQGLFSKRCRQFEDRLQALQVASAKLKVGQDDFTELETVKSRLFKQKFRKLKKATKYYKSHKGKRFFSRFYY
jgi:hypothetical protein